MYSYRQLYGRIISQSGDFVILFAGNEDGVTTHEKMAVQLSPTVGGFSLWVESRLQRPL